MKIFADHGGKIAIAAFGTLAVAAAILLPMTLIKTNLRDAMQGWMNHSFGAGRRWYWVVGGAVGALALGSAGLVLRKPESANKPGFDPNAGAAPDESDFDPTNTTRLYDSVEM